MRCLLLLALLLAAPVHAADRFRVTLDDRIHAVVTLDSADSDPAGVIDIVATASGKRLLRQRGENLGGAVENGKARVNVRELPYGDISAIQYDDFNFDGRKDLALQDGNESCYGGPSFQVYLAQPGPEPRFVLSEAFSALAHDYCGMFAVDAKAKQLHVMTKSGCCYHEYSDFSVVGTVPHLVRRVVEELADYPPYILQTQVWQDGRATIVTESYLADEAKENGSPPYFSFRIKDSGKRLVLLQDGRQDKSALIYLFINAEGRVELMYPARGKTGQFALHHAGSNHTLSFSQGSARYTIYQDSTSKRAGIRVTIPGKTADFVAEPGSIEGTLNFAADEWSNVRVE